jgi:hypothetical protein
VEHPDIHLAMLRGVNGLSPEENIKVNFWLTAVMRSREFAWLQFRDGNIDEMQWHQEVMVIQAILNTAVNRLWWESIGRQVFPAEFVAFVDNHIQDAPGSEALMAKGDAEAALAEGRQETDIAWRLMLISVANYALGHAAESDAALAELVNEYEQSHPLNIATALAFRGEADRAFRWLHRAAEQHDASLGSIIAHRMFDKLHDDPRWLAFLSENGIAPVQLAAIKFDVTVPR